MNKRAKGLTRKPKVHRVLSGAEQVEQLEARELAEIAQEEQEEADAQADQDVQHAAEQGQKKEQYEKSRPTLDNLNMGELGYIRYDNEHEVPTLSPSPPPPSPFLPHPTLTLHPQECELRLRATHHSLPPSLASQHHIARPGVQTHPL
jgi:hypothetical protein